MQYPFLADASAGGPDTLTHVNQVSSGYKQMLSGCLLGLNVLRHAWFYDFIHLNWISCLFNMVFSVAEMELIKTCYVEKGWLGAQIVQEFSGKRRNCRSVNRVIQLFKRTGPDSLGVAGQELHVMEQIRITRRITFNLRTISLGTISRRGKLEIQLGLVKHQSIESPKNLIWKHSNEFKCPGEMKPQNRKDPENLDKRFTKKDVEQMIFTDEKDFTIQVARCLWTQEERNSSRPALSWNFTTL